MKGADPHSSCSIIRREHQVGSGGEAGVKPSSPGGAFRPELECSSSPHMVRSALWHPLYLCKPIKTDVRSICPLKGSSYRYDVLLRPRVLDICSASQLDDMVRQRSSNRGFPLERPRVGASGALPIAEESWLLGPSYKRRLIIEDTMTSSIPNALSIGVVDKTHNMIIGICDLRYSFHQNASESDWT